MDILQENLKQSVQDLQLSEDRWYFHPDGFPHENFKPFHQL